MNGQELDAMDARALWQEEWRCHRVAKGMQSFLSVAAAWSRRIAKHRDLLRFQDPEFVIYVDRYEAFEARVKQVVRGEVPRKKRSWVVTVPKTTPWWSYCCELRAARHGEVLNYKVHRFPKDIQVGDRLYVVHDAKVRGHMVICGLQSRTQPWVCSTTKKTWPAGNYIQRTGAFTDIDGPPMRGFRGVRSYRHGDGS